MSWKNYQHNLSGAVRPKKSKFPRGVFVAGFLLFLGLAYWVLASREDNPEEAMAENKKMDAPQAMANEERKDDSKSLFRGYVSPDQLTQASEDLHVKRGTDEWVVESTIDRDLQKFIDRKLAKYKVDWSGVAVINPRTGEVLALSYHSEKEPGIDHLALRSTFPAASVFKIVTTAAALEEAGYRRDSTVSFRGSMYGINKRQVLKDSGVSGMTLTKAFAKSANVVFGKLGAHAVGGNLLEDYAHRFGFNAPIPFELPVGTSSADIPKEDVMQEARTAAGFGEVTLSPLHGAMLAGAILNEGMMMEPYIVRKVTDRSGNVKMANSPTLWRQPVSAVTAREMRRMMMSTVTEGTAHRSFRRLERDPVLSRLMIGGKTGSLTGKTPPGRNEWIVGYAKGDNNQEIALGIVVVNDKVWRVKPSELMKEIYEFYFSPRPILEANAAKLQPQGP